MENDRFQELVMEKLEKNDKFQELVTKKLEMNDKFQALVIKKFEENDKFQTLAIKKCEVLEKRLEKLEQGQNRLEERMLRLEAKVENEIEVGLKTLLHDNRSLVESSFERISAALKGLTDRQESLNMQLYKHADKFRKIAEAAAG